MNETPTSLVGIRLREERARLDLTQLDAAQKCHVSREQWGRYERGQLPAGQVFVHLVESGFDVKYVLCGQREGEGSGLTALELGLLEHFRATDDDGRATVLRIASMEATRVASLPVNPYAVHHPTRGAVQLHESTPTDSKRKR